MDILHDLVNVKLILKFSIKGIQKRFFKKVLVRKHNTRSASGPTGCTGVQLRSQKGLINSS